MFARIRESAAAVAKSWCHCHVTVAAVGRGGVVILVSVIDFGIRRRKTHRAHDTRPLRVLTLDRRSEGPTMSAKPGFQVLDLNLDNLASRVKSADNCTGTCHCRHFLTLDRRSMSARAQVCRVFLWFAGSIRLSFFQGRSFCLGGVQQSSFETVWRCGVRLQLGARHDN